MTPTDLEQLGYVAAIHQLQTASAAASLAAGPAAVRERHARLLRALDEVGGQMGGPGASASPSFNGQGLGGRVGGWVAC